MSSSPVLSLDLGTTGVRALVIDPDGRVCSRIYAPLAVSYPSPGRVEQDALDMWERSLEVMRGALDEAGIGAQEISAIGVVNQRGPTIAWDARSLEPLAPVIGWQDQRTEERVAEFHAMGIPLTTMASLTKYEWWMKNDETIRASAAAGSLRIGTPDTWLTAKLTGGTAHITDPSNASCTGLLDNAVGEWSAPLVELFSVPADALAEVVATSEVVGETPKSMLGAAIPVAARAGDQQAASFGQGVHRAGEAKLTLGTSAMLDLHTGDVVVEPPRGAFPLSLWRLSSGERAFCVEGTVKTAGSAIEWFVELGLAPDAAAASALAASVDSSEGVCFIPALQGLGTPYGDDNVRAIFTGMTRGSGRAQLARALFEGIAFRCVELATALDLDDTPLRVDGNLARSELLLQLIADHADRDVLRAAEFESTALGAAFLAGLAVGVFENPAHCASLLAQPKRFAPALDESERQAARARWKRAIERILEPN
ncbi:MAG: glycerol kinase [bacterium]|nr:glycerol kinase [bacterium]